MSLRRLTTYVVLIELLGFGVFFTFLLAAVATRGGTATLDMTQYGERWVEYWVALATVAVVPYALYSAERYVDE